MVERHVEMNSRNSDEFGGSDGFPHCSTAGLRIIVTKVATDVLENNESESASSRALILLQLGGRKTKRTREWLLAMADDRHDT
jgi:hypothetical protein